MRFFDAEQMETWLAQNSLKYLGFDLGPKGGPNLGPGKKPGYTIFVLNTWDSPQALSIIRPQHEYHSLLINRTDPDTKSFAGIDWARVWGGNYREVFPTSAPRPTRTSRRRGATAAATRSARTRSTRRCGSTRTRPRASSAHGDFSDPYSPGPTLTWDRNWLNYHLGRFAVDALSYRFLHSYLYEPRPSVGRYYLSSNIWRDSYSTAPWSTDLTKLFNQDLVLQGLRTLVPYFMFTGDTQFQNLDTLSADQAMLQQAKQNGDDVAGTPFTSMHTQTAMDYLDSEQARFERAATATRRSRPRGRGREALRLGPPADRRRRGDEQRRPAVGLPRLGQRPLQDGAGRRGPERAAARRAPRPARRRAHVHVDPRAEPLPRAGAPARHDRRLGRHAADGTKKTEYWDGFSWTFDSTAAPTTYAFDQMTYSILDQETIARGHLAYYLQWTHEALAAGGDAFAAQGLATLGQLPANAQRRRQAALDAMARRRRCSPASTS